jgi:large subunit ribosomal protein L10
MAKEVKKIGLLTREKIVDELTTKVKDTQGCFFVGFNKVQAFGFNTLRNNLKDAGAHVFVAKNSLFKRAMNDLGWQDYSDLLEAETGIVLVYDADVVKSCKVLVDFAKETETLQLKGGVINEKKVTSDEMKNLAKLPSRDVLLGMAVSGIAAPLTGFVNSLNQIILKFVWAVQEIKKVKEEK